MNIMRTNTLYLVRHGENPANITKEFSYKRVDYSLTPKGVLQAEQTAELLKKMPLDAIYSSPLKRAHETAQSIARPHQLPVTIIEGFREINVGDLEQMPPAEAAWRWHDEIIAAWGAGKLETTFPGGENFLELVERLHHGLLEVTRERKNQRIVIAAHGGCITALVHYFCPDASEKLTHADMHNCAITEIELITNGEEMSGSLRCWASIAHLSGEAAAVVTPVLEYEKSQR
jgi:broad specificity phosphatase PhoE